MANNRKAKAPQACIKLVAQALNKAHMERASFHKPGGDPFKGSEQYTAEVKEAIRIYMQSWVLPHLELALDAMRGAAPLREAQGLARYADRAAEECEKSDRRWAECGAHDLGLEGAACTCAREG